MQTTEKITYDDMSLMSDAEVDDLLREGVKTNRPIAIRNPDDHRRLSKAHDRVAATMEHVPIEEIKQLIRYCIGMGI